MSLNETRYLEHLQSSHLGHQLEHFDEVDSTSAYLKRLAREGGAGLSAGHLVLADVQSAGYGQQGRTWVSGKAQGLYCSLYLPVQAPFRPYSLMAGLAAVEAIHACSSTRDVGLKWVNDVVARGRKLGGILAEIVSQPGGPQSLVLGIGLNLETPELPEAIALADLGPVPSREVLLAHLMNRLETWLEASDETVYAQWQRYAVTLGQRVCVQLPSETIEGLAEALTRSGALQLRLDDGSTREIVSGTVRLADGRYC